MKFVKCPRCELNYIREDEKNCPVCERELKGMDDNHDHIELCPICGERPALPMGEPCAQCMREHKMSGDASGEGYMSEPANMFASVDDLEDLELDIDNGDAPPDEINTIHSEFDDNNSNDAY